MPTTEVTNNRTNVIALCAAFVAYFIMDGLTQRVSGGKRKKVIVGVIVLAVTIVAAIALSVVAMYLNKLQVQSTFN